MTTSHHDQDVTLEEAVAALRRAAATPPGDDREGWRRRLRQRLADVEDAMERHTHLTQSREGTFAQALEASLGRVRAEIDRLTRDHVRMWSHVRFLGERLAEPEPDLVADVDALADQVRTHEDNVRRMSAAGRQRLE